MNLNKIKYFWTYTECIKSEVLDYNNKKGYYTVKIIQSIHGLNKNGDILNIHSDFEITEDKYNYLKKNKKYENKFVKK